MVNFQQDDSRTIGMPVFTAETADISIFRQQCIGGTHCGRRIIYCQIQCRQFLKDEGQPINDVKNEKQDGERDQKEFINPPIFFGQLLQRNSIGSCSLLNFILEIVLTDDFDVLFVLARNISLFLEKYGGISVNKKEKNIRCY